MIFSIERLNKYSIHDYFSFMKCYIILVLLVIVNISLSAESYEQVTARGDILILKGRILDVDGNALTEGQVEIWQTDIDGIYDHPGDRDRAKRDRGFQFFGSSVADSMGTYSFRTILPGRYEPRPPHIHVKVRIGGRTKLITQFYFPRDGETAGVGGSAEDLYLDLRDEMDGEGVRFYSAEYDLIIKTGASRGALEPTPSQSEGPYYPVSDVSLYDNDLANHR